MAGAGHVGGSIPAGAGGVLRVGGMNDGPEHKKSPRPWRDRGAADRTANHENKCIVARPTKNCMGADQMIPKELRARWDRELE